MHDAGTEREAELVELAKEIGGKVAPFAVEHDVAGTFVHEAFDLLRASGALAIAVPEELGGRGATIREVSRFQRELAHHCGSTALASSMHQHSTCSTAWRYRMGVPGAEAILRRIAEQGAVIVSTGGADFNRPRGTAEKVDGGYRVSGHKIFASQSPAGQVLSTMFPFDDPEQGKRVLNVSIPIAADGVTVLDNWDTLGMRGTGSNDVIVEDVFVPDDAIGANRPYGVIDPPLMVIGSIAMCVIGGVYLGVAEAAYEAAVAAAAAKAEGPIVQRQVGLMRTRLRVASWALDAGMAVVGDMPVPSVEMFDAIMVAKREVAVAGVEVCDLAMELGGGPAFFKGSVIERCYRDIRAAKFHPLTPELTLLYTGRVALGLPVDQI